MRKKSIFGFTLIELLIVVAIIAILAGIAVPNFLEAQLRSKVSRARADMRSIATALESYHVDQNHYPVPADEHGELVAMKLAHADGFETKLSPLLTTPVAYLSSLPLEPFPSRQYGSENQQYHYTTREYFRDLPGHRSPDEFDGFVEETLGIKRNSSVKYYVLSHGPDRDHDELHGHGEGGFGAEDEDDGDDEHEGEEHEHHVDDGGNLYNPIHGALSNGDIIYFGPGLGFGDFHRTRQ